MNKKLHKYTAWILGELKRGSTTREQILAKFGEKWQKSSRTFDRYWSIAQESYKELLLEAQREQDALYIQNEKRAAEQGILDRNEKLKVLSDIAKGDKARKMGDVSFIPSDNDRVRAIAELNKMQGDYEPEKFKVETESYQLNPSEMSTDAILEFLAAKKKAANGE